MPIETKSKTVYVAGGVEYPTMGQARAATTLYGLQQLGFRPDEAGKIVAKASEVHALLGSYIASGEAPAEAQVST